MFNKFFKKGSSKEIINEPKPVSSAEKVTEPEQVTKLKPIAKIDQGVTMVPIFSFRTVIVAAIGLILGLLLGLVYWILSPSISSSSETIYGTDEEGNTGLIGFLGIEPEGPYESKVRIQVVSPGSEYIPLKNLQQMGEYYSAKASSLPFLEFLDEKLKKQMPGYSYDVDKLSQMITSEYDIYSELPIIKVTVIAGTEAEAGGLAELIPHNFRDYLTTEEQEKKQKEYDATLIEIDHVKAALYDAQKELDAIQANEFLNTNPSYISLKAKADALQQLLDVQVIQLASEAIVDKDINKEYDNIKRMIGILYIKTIRLIIFI